MKKVLFGLFTCALAFTACTKNDAPKAEDFVRIEGVNLIEPDGDTLFIKGTNLGNWLNPEGYMFGFSRTNSGWMIDEMLREMVGPDAADDFWKAFKDNYITRKDVEFIKEVGSNTIRLPFNYKLFTDIDFLGKTHDQDGFARVDSVVQWCKDNDLWLILDMHDCPGGQTGDNIDDGYGYPWLFQSERAQAEFIDIWSRIAARYKDEPTVMAYELMNEPIAHYFENKEELYLLLEPLYKKTVKAIREVDTNHIIMLGGAHWNSNFEVFTDWQFDDKIMYTCHRYGGGSMKEAFQSYIDFRDKTQLPMYMGETGHNSLQWQKEVAMTLYENNIGYTFWPYKKVDESCFVGINRPEGWDSLVVKFSEAPRGTYSEIRDARPNQGKAHEALTQFIENCKFENCKVNDTYIASLLISDDDMKAALSAKNDSLKHAAK